jgi:ABC-type phosphate transport system substrate-binding protein
MRNARLTLFALLFFAGTAAVAQAAKFDVIVNSANTNTVDLEKIRNIFLGRVRSFKEGEPARPLDLPEGSPVRSKFYAALLGKSDMDMKLYWSTSIFTGAGIPPKTLENEASVIQNVKNNPSAIGYVPAGSADKGVRVLTTLSE